MHVENKEFCTGCGACYNVCSKSAISMKQDEYGFYKPFIDTALCIDCGLCDKTCPLNNYVSSNAENPKCYAFQNKDEETLYKCASGGAFALLAKYVIEQGGIVYGVIYDKNLNVCHSRADNLKDLEKMYSSKYVQSNIKDTFKQAKQDSDNGKQVLFSGTPCQIAGLKSYLIKDYENLITIDLVCHGTPSPLVFEKYKKEISRKFGNIKNINFRSKIKGWNPYYLTIQTDNNIIDIPSKDSVYMKLFLNDLSTNKSCSNCQFNKLPRVADITLGDFWGVNQYKQELNNNKGLSVVLANNIKGQNLCQQICKDCIFEEVPLDIVIKYNKNIVASSSLNPKRIEFFSAILKKKNLKSCVKKFIKGEKLYMKIYKLLPKPVKNVIKSLIG